jgi:hypothetical protein
LRVDVVELVEVEGNVLQVVLHLGVTDSAEEVLGVDLTVTVLEKSLSSATQKVSFNLTKLAR